MKKLFVFLKDYKKECVLGPFFKLLEASFELFVPLVMAAIVDKGIKNNDTGYILTMCGVLVGLGVVGLACSLTAQFFAAKAATGFSAKLRHSLMAHISNLSYREIDTLGTATMITRMTSDVNQVQNGINLALRLLLRSPFVVFGAMIMAFTIDWQAALVFAGVIPILCLVVFGIMLWTIPKYKKVQGNLDEVTMASRENLNGVRVVRAFCKEQAEIDEFEVRTLRLSKIQSFVAKISALMNPVTFIIINIAIMVLIWVGAVRVDIGILTQGQVLALYNYMSQILVELIKMADLIITMTKAAACGGRISAVLDTEPSQSDGIKSIKNNDGTVEFKDVVLKYYEDSDPAVSKISFKANKGDTIGVIGGTGSGKSTLVNLIPRFYDVTEGAVIVDDENVNQVKLYELRDKVGIVPQKAVLFAGTIRSNLLWGNKNATDEEMNEALKIAQAKEIVDGKEGLDTYVAQGGKNFSGGQKQRLTIARALVRRPEILILDDSASALDYATDANLRKAISQMDNPPTTFIVSQRASSILNADLILVLDDGELVGKGTHEELLDSCEVYREIYLSQFSKEVTA